MGAASRPPASTRPALTPVPPQGDTSSTRYQVELGDGVRTVYQNLTLADEPVRHRYRQPGVYRVTVRAENAAGHDRATLYIQVTGESRVQHVSLRPGSSPSRSSGRPPSARPGPGPGFLLLTAVVPVPQSRCRRSTWRCSPWWGGARR